MKLFLGVSVLACAACFCASTPSEAPTGFDNKTNGMVDDATHAVDQDKFDEVEQVSDGLGPLYNAQSCRKWDSDGIRGKIGRCRGDLARRKLVRLRQTCPDLRHAWHRQPCHWSCCQNR